MGLLLLSRRRLIAGAAALAAAGCAASPRRAERGPIALALPGRTTDERTFELARKGLERVQAEFDIPVRTVEAPDDYADALRTLARSDATLVLAFGANASTHAQRVAWEFPKQRFAGIGGRDLRPNLAIYEILGEELAWLTGALAGSVTRSGTVAHIGVGRSAETNRLRAAFAAGVRAANPGARLLTRLLDRDNPEDAATLARKQLEAGADVLYAALERGASAAIETCRAHRAAAIARVPGALSRDAEAVLAEAHEDPGFAVYQAGRDLRDGVLRGDFTRSFGVRHPEALRLALGARVDAATRERIEGWRGEIIARKIPIPTQFSGPEFGA